MRGTAEAIEADVACNDQEIAYRDVRQEAVLIAEGNDTHQKSVLRQNRIARCVSHVLNLARDPRGHFVLTARHHVGALGKRSAGGRPRPPHNTGYPPRLRAKTHVD